MVESRRCTRCSTRPRRLACLEQRFAAELTSDADTATATAMRVTGKIPDPSHGIIAVPMAVTTRIWGTLHETLAGDRHRQRLEHGGAPLARGAVPRPARRRAAAAGTRRCRRAARCWPPTARRWPRVPIATRRSRRSRSRSSARSSAIPQDRGRPLHGDGLPAGRQGRLGRVWSTSSRRGWPVRSVASCWPARGCWPAPNRSRDSRCTRRSIPGWRPRPSRRSPANTRGSR